MLCTARFDRINFYQNRPKIVILPKKYKIFGALGAPPPDPRNSPPLQNSHNEPARSTDSLVEE